MMKFAIFFVLLALMLRTSGFAQSSKTDEGEQGPANFYYVQHEEEPWRINASKRELLYKSAEIGVAIVILFGYIQIQKRKT